MKNKWNQRFAVLAAAALILTIGTTVGRAIAYFTTYVVAEGGKELNLGFTTTIPHEEKESGAKLITIENTGDKDCYVRVKVFAGSKHKLTFPEGESDSRWKEKEGYYYWTEILPAHESTKTLKVGIAPGEIEADSFNVIVVQECTPIPYNEQGEIIPWDKVDWDRTADVVKTETSSTIPVKPDEEKKPDAVETEDKTEAPDKENGGEGN